MTRFVLDASCAAAWSLPDERAVADVTVLTRLREHGAVVPALFWFEIWNFHVTNERRGRLTATLATAFLADLQALPIDVDAKMAGDQIITLARTSGLTAYDASYLELALRLGIPLATLDRRLAQVAAATGVTVL